LPTRAIQERLVHRSILHTVRYTELSPARFKNFYTVFTINIVCQKASSTSLLS
jgi:hypothetical protein